MKRSLFFASLSLVSLVFCFDLLQSARRYFAVVGYRQDCGLEKTKELGTLAVLNCFFFVFIAPRRIHKLRLPVRILKDGGGLYRVHFYFS